MFGYLGGGSTRSGRASSGGHRSLPWNPVHHLTPCFGGSPLVGSQAGAQGAWLTADSAKVHPRGGLHQLEQDHGIEADLHTQVRRYYPHALGHILDEAGPAHQIHPREVFREASQGRRPLR